MKLLISGYFIYGHSGYGIQTIKLAKYFQKNHEIAFAFWDIKERKTSYVDTLSNVLVKENINIKYDSFDDCLTLIPSKPLSKKDNEYWDEMKSICEHFKPDKILTIHDIWTIPLVSHNQLNVSMYCWLPIHYDPPEKQTISHLEHFDGVLSTSLWGKGVLSKYHNNVHYIPHPIDSIYYDGVFSNSQRKQEIRKLLSIPQNAFVILVVARNSEKSNRKGFNTMINVFAHYKKNKNPLAHMHMHVNIVGAVDIQGIANHHGVESCITCSDQNKLLSSEYTSKDVRDMYIMSDILLNASAAEGFGLPLIEAQACGLPVMGTNCTAISENVLMGKLSNPIGPIKGNVGSFSQPDDNQVFNDLVELERNMPNQVEKNMVRNIIKSQFNDGTVYSQMFDSMHTHPDVKIKSYFHDLHTYEIKDISEPVIAYSETCGFSGNKHCTMKEAYDVELNDDYTDTIKGVILTDKLTTSTEYILGLYENEIRHMTINETYIDFKDSSTTLKLPVKVNVDKTHVFKQYVLSQFNDMGMLFNMDTEKVSYIRIGDPFDVSSFLMSEDKLIIYGKNDSGCIVKIINFEHPVVQPGELE